MPGTSTTRESAVFVLAPDVHVGEVWFALPQDMHRLLPTSMPCAGLRLQKHSGVPSKLTCGKRANS